MVNLGPDTSICPGQTLLLKPSFSPSQYIWQDGTVQPQYTVTQPGIYTVSVQNKCGLNSDSIAVMKGNCTCKFFMPTAFTPNHDGNNDFFKPLYTCSFVSFHLQIFNRLGQMIFETKNADRGWDGTYHYLPQPLGTYVWKLIYKDILNGQNIAMQGSVVLLR
jgi:gliding motility-associated-like protein